MSAIPYWSLCIESRRGNVGHFANCPMAHRRQTRRQIRRCKSGLLDKVSREGYCTIISYHSADDAEIGLKNDGPAPRRRIRKILNRAALPQYSRSPASLLFHSEIEVPRSMEATSPSSWQTLVLLRREVEGCRLRLFFISESGTDTPYPIQYWTDALLQQT